MPSERNVRAVEAGETMMRVRQNAKAVMECLEAFRVAFEDGININPVAAQDELKKALDAAHVIYLDSYGDEQEETLDYPVSWNDLTPDERSDRLESAKRYGKEGHPDDFLL